MSEREYCLPEGDDGMGMTDAQYKGMLLDQLEVWKKANKMAVAVDAKDLIELTEEQIAKIDEKLKF